MGGQNLDHPALLTLDPVSIKYAPSLCRFVRGRRSGHIHATSSQHLHHETGTTTPESGYDKHCHAVAATISNDKTSREGWSIKP